MKTLPIAASIFALFMGLAAEASACSRLPWGTPLRLSPAELDRHAARLLDTPQASFVDAVVVVPSGPAQWGSLRLERIWRGAAPPVLPAPPSRSATCRRGYPVAQERGMLTVRDGRAGPEFLHPQLAEAVRRVLARR